MNIEERFWSKVKAGKPDECWPWQASINAQGYGYFRLDGKMWKAHRVAYMLHNEEDPDIFLVRHSCDNTSCCNPQHLILGTHVDNAQDAIERGQMQRGERSGRAVMTDAKVIKMREEHAAGISQRELAKQYGIGHNTAHCILSRKTWSHV